MITAGPAGSGARVLGRVRRGEHRGLLAAIAAGAGVALRTSLLRSVPCVTDITTNSGTAGLRFAL